MSAPVTAFPIGRDSQRDETNKGFLGAGQNSDQSHNDEAKVTRQIRALKQNFGLGSILGTIAIIIAIGAPVVRQGELNGTYATAIDRIAAAQKETKEEQAKALNDAVARIEAGIKQSIDLAAQNREEMRTMRGSIEDQIREQRQKADALWNWNGKLDGQVKALETEVRLNRKKEN